MSAWMDKVGPVIGDSVYCDKKLVARDVTCTIPMPKWQTADIEANGTLSVPLVGRADNMDFAVTKVGVDEGYAAMCVPGAHDVEVRWVDPVIDDKGVVHQIGKRAYMRTLAGSPADIGLENGSVSELETTFPVLRVRIVENGVETFVYDRLAGTLRVNGKDYSGNKERFL